MTFPFFWPQNLHSIQISQFGLKPCGRMLEEPPSLRCVLCEAVIFFRDGRWSRESLLWHFFRFLKNIFFFFVVICCRLSESFCIIFCFLRFWNIFWFFQQREVWETHAWGTWGEDFEFSYISFFLLCDENLNAVSDLLFLVKRLGRKIWTFSWPCTSPRTWSGRCVFTFDKYKFRKKYFWEITHIQKT